MNVSVPHTRHRMHTIAAMAFVLLFIGLPLRLHAQNGKAAASRGGGSSILVDAPILQSPSDGDTTVSINPTFVWSAARGAETYQIEIATSNLVKNDGSFQNRNVVASANSSTTSWSASGLSPNTLYYWHVGADSGSGNSKTTSWSTTFSFRTAPVPSIPVLLSPANNATGVSTSPTLNWGISTNAESYVVQYTTGGSTVQNSVTSTSFTATGLSKNTTYSWQVKAVGRGGESAFSSAWTFKTGGGPPAAPALTSPSDGATNVSISPTLSWNAVTGATSYSVDVSKVSNFSQITASSASQNATNFTVILEYNTQYWWRVKAMNADGASSYSTASFKTLSAKPSAPLLISPSDGAKDVPLSGRFEWSVIPGATSYDIQVDTDNKFNKPIISANPSSAFYSYSGLLNAQVYYWRVQVTTAAGASGYSSPASFMTVAAKISAPTLQTPANGALNVPVNATLTWSSINNATYDVEVSDTVSFSRIASGGTGLRNNSFSTATLANNKTYFWHVRAATSSSTSDWSAAWIFTTETGKLQAPILVSPVSGADKQPTELALNWQSVTGALSYGLEITTDKNFNKDLTTVNGVSITSDSLRGLSPNTTYYWRVHAANAQGPGDWSEVWNFTTVSSTVAAPILQEPADKKSGVSTAPVFQWNAVANATSYWLQVSTTNKFDAGTIVVDHSGITGTITQATGLLNKTTYYWKMKATGSAGSGDWSSVWEFTTMASQLLAPLLVTPSDGATTSTHPTLNWTSVSGATSYVLQYSTDRNFRTSVIEKSGITTPFDTLRGLLPTTTYYWQVRAKDSLNISDWSRSSSFTTGTGLLSPPPLIDPVDNAPGVSLNAVLSWGVVAGAKSYGVQVSGDKNFNKIVLDTSGVVVRSLALKNLGKKTTYYWRVNAADVNGAGNYSEPWSFTTGSGQLSAPLLSSPLDGAQAVSVRPSLVWNAVLGATAYSLQISDDRQFRRIVFSKDSLRASSFTLKVELSPNTTYYWQVRATDSLIVSDWSGIWDFTTGSGRLSAPTLVYPPDKTDNVPVNTTLSWSSIVGAVSYSIQVASDNKFNTIVFQRDSVKTTSIDVSGFAVNQRYYWHANAVDSSGKKSDWSTDWMFTTGSSILAAPQLVYPSNGTVGTSISPKLEWTVVKGATSYNLQYASDKNFRKDLIEVSGLMAAAYQISVLAVNTTYYWRVQSKIDTVSSAWSDYWSFITGNGVLATPVLSSPEDGAEVSTSLVLKWNGSEGAKMYALQVSEGSNFNKLIIDETSLTAPLTTTTIEYSLSGLETRKTYYWRVRALRDNETSDWTPTWKFKTSVTTYVETVDSPIPSEVRLSQNYPNPFNPTTTIEFSLPKSGDVKVMIFNILGQLISTLVDQHLPAGAYRTQWNASAMPSGIYFYRLHTNGMSQTKRLVLIK